MSNNLGSNPFSALFGSLNEAANFTQQQQQAQHLQNPESHNECPQESTSGVAEDSGISEEAKKCVKINEMIEDIFHLTLNKSQQVNRNGLIRELVYLEDLASAMTPQDWIDIETLEQALFERLLLDDPSEHIVDKCVQKKESYKPDIHATQREVMSYLFECYRRLIKLKNPSKADLNAALSQMISLVMRNVATALRQPELFESQDLHSQILYLTTDDSISKTDLEAFFDDIVKEFINDEDEDGSNSLLTAFTPLLDKIHKEMAQSNLFTFNRAHFCLLHIFSSRSHLAAVLLTHSKPKNSTSGFSYSNTLIGSILCLSCLPKTHDGLYEFFEKPSLQTASVTEGNIWTATEVVIENMHTIFHSLLKCSNEIKHRTLSWLADCLHANAGRGKLWNSHGLNLGASVCVSDGFMLNLSAVLLHLCQPFCSDKEYLKLLRIDPTYCAVKLNSEEEVRVKGVHMKDLANETCLIPASEDTPRPTSETYGFVSECFYLAHKALDLGFRVTFEHLMRLNQDLARIQRAFIDAQNQAGANAEVVRAIGERIEMEMSR